jgi:hypothetical protein
LEIEHDSNSKTPTKFGDDVSGTKALLEIKLVEIIKKH